VDSNPKHASTQYSVYSTVGLGYATSPGKQLYVTLRHRRVIAVERCSRRHGDVRRLYELQTQTHLRSNSQVYGTLHRRGAAPLCSSAFTAVLCVTMAVVLCSSVSLRWWSAPLFRVHGDALLCVHDTKPTYAPTQYSVYPTGNYTGLGYSMARCSTLLRYRCDALLCVYMDPNTRLHNIQYIPQAIIQV
jgi:hypothetical protein